jgi:hypothetical protein
MPCATSSERQPQQLTFYPIDLRAGRFERAASSLSLTADAQLRRTHALSMICGRNGRHCRKWT